MRKRHLFLTWIKARKQNKPLALNLYDQSTVFDAICVVLEINCSANLIIGEVLTKMNFSTGIHHTLSLILCRTAVFKNVSFRRPSMAASVSCKSTRREVFLQNSFSTSALKTIAKCLWRSSTFSILVQGERYALLFLKTCFKNMISS